MAFPHVNWKRPKSCEYPRVWHNFKVKKIDSDELEEYCIQDLPESRIEEVLEFLIENLCKHEPVCKAYGKLNFQKTNKYNLKQTYFTDIYNEKDIIKSFVRTWRSIINQKTVLVCFRKGSDEIVGITMNYIVRKYDYLRLYLSFYRLRPLAVDPEVVLKWNNMNDINQSIYKNFNEFKHYGVNEYLTSAGLAVAWKYRGRGIGAKLLKTREIFCNEFGIKLTLDSFTSDAANVCANKAGYKLERIFR